jgi:hypothetical protein
LDVVGEQQTVTLGAVTVPRSIYSNGRKFFIYIADKLRAEGTEKKSKLGAKYGDS